MKTHFRQIFWGLLIVYAIIEINDFDLLADGVGFVLMALGCGGLVPLSARFAAAGMLCWMLAVLWLVGFAVPPKQALIYGIPYTLVNCVMIWQLLGGIRDFALDRARPDLAQWASNRRIAFIVVMGVAAVLAPIAQSAHDWIGPLVVAAVVAGLVVLVMILHLIHRVRKELATDDDNEPEPIA